MKKVKSDELRSALRSLIHLAQKSVNLTNIQPAIQKSCMPVSLFVKIAPSGNC